jgi:hypothetical protein
MGHTDKDNLLDVLDVDVRRLNAPAPPECALDGGVFQNFWGERFINTPTRWGPVREDPKGALADAGGLPELEAFAWPTPDCLDRSNLKSQCVRYEQHALL